MPLGCGLEFGVFVRIVLCGVVPRVRLKGISRFRPLGSGIEVGLIFKATIWDSCSS